MTTEEGGGTGQGVPGQVRRRPRAQRRRSGWGRRSAAPSATTTSIDPFTTRDFYAPRRLLRRPPAGGRRHAEADARVPTPEQEAESSRLQARIARLQAASRERPCTTGANPRRAARRGTGREGATASVRSARRSSRSRAAARHPRAAPRQLAGREPARSSSRPCRGSLQAAATCRRPPRHAARPGPLAGRRRSNPLTARVFVNRLWKLFFGTRPGRHARRPRRAGRAGRRTPSCSTGWPSSSATAAGTSSTWSG